MRSAVIVGFVLAACGSSGSHALDAAGGSDSTASPDACAVVDCAGTCNGSAVAMDCSGSCGTRTLDRCGVCDDDPANDCKWPDSTTAYCSTGTAVATCPSNPQGQDGDYQIHVPTYVVTATTVTDPITGLVWQRVPPTTAITHASAVSYCNNLSLASQTDWRLPTRLELASLTDDGSVLPPLDHAVFTSVPQNSDFWTSTPSVATAGASWEINTNYPSWGVVLDTTSAAMLVRCVRGASPFTGSLVVVGGAVFDGRTNRFWQSATAGSTMTWPSALAYCEALSLDAHDDWRLPTAKELASIVDDTTSNPAISPLFATRPATVFWSSSPCANFVTEGYAVDFSDGTSGTSSAFTTKYDVRCVRSIP